MDFPILYGKAVTGKTKRWELCVVEHSNNNVEIRSTYGYVDGKQRISSSTVTCGKNIGKKNETSPLEQAIKEATFKWNKKLKEDYNTSLKTSASVGSTMT